MIMDWKTIFDNVLVSKEEAEIMSNEYNRFINLINGNLPKTSVEETKNAFVASGNAIASISNRPFWKDEPKKLLNKWDSIAEKLKELQKEPSSEKYVRFQTYIVSSVLGITDDMKTEKGKKYPKPYASTLRLAASVLPDYLCSIANESDIDKLIVYLNKNVKASITGDNVFDKSHNLFIIIKTAYFNWKRNNNIEGNLNGDDKSYYCLPWKILEYFKGKDFDEIKKILDYNKNIILTGAPGTGKTFLAKSIASYIITGNSDFENLNPEEQSILKSQYKFVQFHPSYDYTDFVEGLRPVKSNEVITFERQDGKFKSFCAEAAKEMVNKSPFVFVIDEINRGEISKIFGELFFSIDPGYRGVSGMVDTQYQSMEESYKNTDPFKDGFYVPENVYIIGTMNDIDRSVESMDFAFRRRFAFYEVTAESSQRMLEDLKLDFPDIIERMTRLNNAIVKEGQLTTAYQLGGAYFKKIKDIKPKNGAYTKLWEVFLKGVLLEYFRGLPQKEINDKMEKLKKAYDGK